MNNVVTMFLLIIIVAIIGVSIGLTIENVKLDEKAAENQELRAKLNLEIHHVQSLRLALSEERKLYEEKIKESVIRYNELEHLHKKNEDALRSELERIKKSTVKDLEDEAERIYSAGCKQ